MRKTINKDFNKNKNKNILSSRKIEKLFNRLDAIRHHTYVIHNYQVNSLNLGDLSISAPF